MPIPAQAYATADEKLRTVEAAIGALSGGSTNAAAAKSQFDALAKCRGEIASLIAGDKDADPSPVEIAALRSRVVAQEAKLGDMLFGAPPLHDNRKLLFGEHGSWARHFSTVRMTVMTFTVSTCAAIFALSVRGAELSKIIGPIAVLWGLGSLTFWIFTFYTYKKVRSQWRMRNWLPDGIHASESGYPVQVDLASFVVPLFTLALWWLGHSHGIVTCPAQHAAAIGFTALGCAIPFGTRWCLGKTSSDKFLIHLLKYLACVGFAALAAAATYYAACQLCGQ
jgi:hypothetical protein